MAVRKTQIHPWSWTTTQVTLSWQQLEVLGLISILYHPHWMLGLHVGVQHFVGEFAVYKMEKLFEIFESWWFLSFWRGWKYVLKMFSGKLVLFHQHPSFLKHYDVGNQLPLVNQHQHRVPASPNHVATQPPIPQNTCETAWECIIDGLYFWGRMTAGCGKSPFSQSGFRVSGFRGFRNMWSNRVPLKNRLFKKAGLFRMFPTHSHWRA